MFWTYPIQCSNNNYKDNDEAYVNEEAHVSKSFCLLEDSWPNCCPLNCFIVKTVSL